MSYINDYNSLMIKPGNRIQNNYVRNSSEDIFKRNKFVNYDKIYNQFLTSPYPPMYYKRSSRYNDDLYKVKPFNEKENLVAKDNNNYQYTHPQDYNEIRLLDHNKINSYNTKINNEYNYLNNNKDLEEEIKKEPIYSRNKILDKSLINNSRNYHYNNYGNLTEYDDININNNLDYQISNNINDKNTLDVKNSFHKMNNINNLNNIDINNNRLSVSNDKIRETYNNKGYVSPIIAQIAKKNYLENNPYSAKEQNLGPSMLKINPILYPIDTYKFDFNRYIKGDFVNKYP